MKKKLVSPFVHALGGKMAHYSWTRQLAPEAIWIVLLIDRFGFEPGRKLCSILAQAAVDVIDKNDLPAVVKLSHFNLLSDAQRVEVVARLDQATLKSLRSALAPLAGVVADHPLSFLGQPDLADVLEDNHFPGVLQQCYDRNSRLAVLSMAVSQSLMLDQGKLFIAEHLIDGLIERFAAIETYPDTEASRNAASGFRAAAPMLFMSPTPDGNGHQADDPWVRAFWDGVAGFGPCIFDETLENEEVPNDDPVGAFIVGFRNAVRADLRARLERWPLDLNEAEAYEVTAGLLCRQATIALEFSTAPQIWTPNSSPIFLRAIADVFISLAWLLQDPVPRAQLFVEDGLGAIKLQIAHHERSLEATEDPADQAQLRAMIETWKGWLASQRIDIFLRSTSETGRVSTPGRWRRKPDF